MRPQRHSGQSQIKRDGRFGLALFGRAAPDQPLGFAQVDLRSGEVVSRGLAARREEAPAASSALTVLILSAAEAQVRRLAMPARTDAQARAGVRYLLEGQIVADDTVAFAVSPPLDADGHRLAVAYNPARLAQWQDACRRLGAEPAAIYLDAGLWPVDAHGVEVVAMEDRLLVAGGAHGGFAIEADLAPAVFARWASQNGLIARRVGLDPSMASAWRTAPGINETVLVERPGADPVLALAAAAFDPPDYSVDLRQVEAAAGAPQRPQWRFWLLTAVLAVLAVLAQAGVQLAQGLRDDQEAAAVASIARQELSAARPEIKLGANFTAQLRGLLKADAQSRAHPVLTSRAPIQAAMAANPEVRLDELRHQAPGRQLELRVSAQSPPAIEKLSTWMKANGMNAQFKAVAPQEGRYTADVSVEAAP